MTDRHHRRRRGAGRPLAAVVAVTVLLLVVAGCGDSGETTTSGPPVSFGEGSVPDAFPEDFPIPADAIIGTTLVDRINDRSEMEVRVQAGTASVVAFYIDGLTAAGFEVTDDAETDRLRTVAFADGDTTVVVVISEDNPGISRAIIEINRS